MSTDYERQKKYMDSKKARGYAKKALWIHESKYPELKQEAERLNMEAERTDIPHKFGAEDITPDREAS